MTKKTVLLCSLALTCLVARTAAAGVCVDVDASRDNLPEPDRNALRTLLASTLAQQGQQVTGQPCQGTYVVYHVKLGNSVSVFMQGPQGYRQASARSVEDVPSLYSQMVRSLLTGQPMNTANDTVDRQNATAAQAAPQRVEADSLWYVRLGYAGAIGKSLSSGPSIGFGYRYELDNFGIDVSAFNFMIDTGENNSSTGSNSAGFTGSWIKLMGLYFMNPMANRSSYLGGGLSWGGTAIVDNNSTLSGTGLQAEVSAGYELLRASTIRMFIQADATLPLYSLKQTTVAAGGTLSTDRSYAPTFAISFGLGWGRSLTRVHVIQ
jgi:hypothetical protein